MVFVHCECVLVFDSKFGVDTALQPLRMRSNFLISFLKTVYDDFFRASIPEQLP